MRQKKLLKYFTMFFAIGLGLYLSLEPFYTPTAIITPPHMFNFPRIIAHKSIVSGDFQGNTLEAILDALGSDVRGIEVDVRSSKDNVLFLYHADRLEIYTNGHGKPEDHTWEELAKLSYKGNIPTHLVTLDQLLSLVGTQKFVFLDIKSNGLFEQKIAHTLITLIKKHHLQENVVVESFNPLFLVFMRLLSRDVMLMYDFVEKTEAIGEEVQAQFDRIPWILKQPWMQKQIRRIVRPDMLGPRFNTDKKILKSLIDHGYPLISWTVDDVTVEEELYALGVKGFQTNKPLMLGSLRHQTTRMVYDAGGTKVCIGEVIPVSSMDDIVKTVKRAILEHKHITIAGRRHSMGGQTLLEHSLQLDMLNFNHVTYDSKTKRVRAQAGASWKKIQGILDAHHRSVSVMQSDNIFTVGGSVSVNVHGWQVGSPPIASTVMSMTVVTADGTIKRISKNSDPDLLRAILGGYGLFAVIVDVELETVDNPSLTFHAKFMPPQKLAHNFERWVQKNPRAELAYARLSVDQKELFHEVGLFWYERSDQSLVQSIKPESLIALKRGLFRTSQYGNLGKKVRWSAEKLYAKMMARGKPISRNNAMNTDIHVLWPLYGTSKDILHEYFVPKHKVAEFIDRLRKNILQYDINMLNVTIREVKKDSLSLLPYAREDVFSLVCLISQKQTDLEERVMEGFTKATIQDVLALGGTFYLPYRLHYDASLLLKAYPHILKWLQFKNKVDPSGVFQSNFFQYIEKILHPST